MTLANQFAPIWNSSGVNYNAIRADVTDIASSGGSTLLDLRVNNSGVFSVNKTGAVTFAGNSLQGLLDGKLSLTGGTLTGGLSGTTGTFSNFLLSGSKLNITEYSSPYIVSIRASTVWSAEPLLTGYPWHFAWVDDIPKITIQCANAPLGIKISSDSFFAFTNSTNSRSGTVDLSLVRDASNTLAQRNSTNAQRFNLYGTYTDASNYRRLYLSSTTAGAFTIGVEGAGTGVSGNTLTINNSLTVAGELFPQSLYVNSSNWFGVANRSIFSSPSDGVMKLTNWADNNFFRLQLGGTNSSFPAIKRNGTAINFRLADDSADAPITASNGTFSGALSAVTKSFLIDHPTKLGRKLQYGSLESPYHGIRLTGRSFVEGGIGVIELPDYVRAFVSDDVNIQLTPVGRNILWVDCIDLNNNQVIVGGDSDGDFYWSFTGIRTDVELEVEPWA